MGMLGAMAGLGKGLQDFSTLMNEKSKMDWMAQQEAIKHERALSLEALQSQRAVKLKEMENTGAMDRLTVQGLIESGHIDARGNIQKQLQELQGQYQLENTKLGQTLSGRNQQAAIAAQGAEERKNIQARGTIQSALSAQEGGIKKELMGYEADLKKMIIEAQGDKDFENKSKVLGAEVDAHLNKFRGSLAIQSASDKAKRVEQAEDFKMISEKDGTPMNATETLFYSSLYTGIDPAKLVKPDKTSISGEDLGKIETFLARDEVFNDPKTPLSQRLKMIGQVHSYMKGQSDTPQVSLDSEQVIKMAADINSGNKGAKEDYFKLDLGTRVAIDTASKFLKEKQEPTAVVQKIDKTFYQSPTSVDNPGMLSGVQLGQAMYGRTTYVPKRAFDAARTQQEEALNRMSSKRREEAAAANRQGW